MGKLKKLLEQFLNKPPEVRFEDVRYDSPRARVISFINITRFREFPPILLRKFITVAPGEPLRNINKIPQKL